MARKKRKTEVAKPYHGRTIVLVKEKPRMVPGYLCDRAMWGLKMQDQWLFGRLQERLVSYHLKWTGRWVMLREHVKDYNLVQGMARQCVWNKVVKFVLIMDHKKRKANPWWLQIMDRAPWTPHEGKSGEKQCLKSFPWKDSQMAMCALTPLRWYIRI